MSSSKKDSVLSIQLKTESGYRTRETHNLSLDQWRKIQAVLAEREAPNATFWIFKPSGKYYTHERGYTIAQEAFITQDTRAAMLAANDGRMPGLSGVGSEFFVMVVPDDDLSNDLMGVPVMMPPREACGE